MKKWNAPAIQELNLSNTESGKSLTSFVDAAVYDVDHDRNLYSYSGAGNNADEDVHVTPAH